MKDLLTFIFYVLASREQARISEADANPDKWYEVVSPENGLTKTLQKSNILAGIVPDFWKHTEKYRFDEINIVIMENRKSPKQIFGFFSDSLIYSIIHDYFGYAEKLEDMRFVGKIIFSADGSAPQFKKAYYDYGEEAEIFIDEIAFCYFSNLICYIPDSGEEDNPEDGCTYNDFVSAAEDEDIARILFKEVIWEYPSTLVRQWEMYGVFDHIDMEEDNKPTIYSYTGSGDFVHCNNCDKIMLLPTGADKCPACHREGTLGWEDLDLQEATREELSALEEYELIVEPEPEPSEYLSDEVMRGEFEKCPDTVSHALLWRIVLWEHNRGIDERLTEELFIRYFGKCDGNHFYSKWKHYDYNFMKMIGYFGSSTGNGQKFCDMVLEQMIKYEQRIKSIWK